MKTTNFTNDNWKKSCAVLRDRMTFVINYIGIIDESGTTARAMFMNVRLVQL